MSSPSQEEFEGLKNDVEGFKKDVEARLENLDGSIGEVKKAGVCRPGPPT